MIVDPEKHAICPMAAMKYFPDMSQSSVGKYV